MEHGESIPRLSYSCDEMQTQALFWAGKAKLDSRIGGKRTGGDKDKNRTKSGITGSSLLFLEVYYSGDGRNKERKMRCALALTEGWATRSGFLFGRICTVALTTFLVTRGFTKTFSLHYDALVLLVLKSAMLPTCTVSCCLGWLLLFPRSSLLFEVYLICTSIFLGLKVFRKFSTVNHEQTATLTWKNPTLQDPRYRLQPRTLEE